MCGTERIQEQTKKEQKPRITYEELQRSSKSANSSNFYNAHGLSKVDPKKMPLITSKMLHKDFNYYDFFPQNSNTTISRTCNYFFN